MSPEVKMILLREASAIETAHQGMMDALDKLDREIRGTEMQLASQQARRKKIADDMKAVAAQRREILDLAGDREYESMNGTTPPQPHRHL